MISTNDIRPGMALDLPEGLFTIVEFQHVKPGKGHAFVRTKLKSLDSGNVLDKTFRADEKVPLAIIEKRSMQFLYSDGANLAFMDTTSYEQEEIAVADAGEAVNYLSDGDVAEVHTHNGRLISIELPASTILEVTETEPGIKGDRVSGATKPATTETGLLVQVPLFVDIGDKIKVDTRSGEYITRV